MRRGVKIAGKREREREIEVNPCESKLRKEGQLGRIDSSGERSSSSGRIVGRGGE